MLRGLDVLTNAVKVTLGPKCRNVVIDKSFGAPRITKDGVTVVRGIEPEDKFENRGFVVTYLRNFTGLWPGIISSNGEHPLPQSVFLKCEMKEG
ncbi:hypothetical protein AB4Z52_32000 [Rhizobium sp. 2YAF20]